MRIDLRTTSALCILAASGACTTAPNVAESTMRMEAPTINPTTQTEYMLKWLPKPRERVPIAVYGVLDETGAFKPTDAGQTLSRAVTQGATPMLVKALQDAGNRSWFTVIERTKLDNLLKERQIILEMRQRYLGEPANVSNALPSLLFAGVLLEGAITGYDTNLVTGGAGAQYLGIGASTQYREDAVSVYLRAVSVKSGEVLLSVTSEQRIASMAVQGNAFKFVAFRELLEAETGYTLNQPNHLAVRQALEKAVYGLIVEGSRIGIWAFDDPQVGEAAINYYDENYAANYSFDLATQIPPEFIDAARRDGRLPDDYNGEFSVPSGGGATDSDDVSSMLFDEPQSQPAYTPEPAVGDSFSSLLFDNRPTTDDHLYPGSDFSQKLFVGYAANVVDEADLNLAVERFSALDQLNHVWTRADREEDALII